MSNEEKMIELLKCCTMLLTSQLMLSVDDLARSPQGLTGEWAEHAMLALTTSAKTLNKIEGRSSDN